MKGKVKAYKNALELIGRTPLVKLNKIVKDFNSSNKDKIVIKEKLTLIGSVLGILQDNTFNNISDELKIKVEKMISERDEAKNNKEVKHDLERVYEYFPRLKERRTSQAGYTSGGEQQMLAIGRAMIARPKLLMLDEPSLGLSPILVRQLFHSIQVLAN